MVLSVIKAALLAEGLAAALLILPMRVSASNSFLNQPARSAKIRQSDARQAPGGVPKRSPLLWGIGACCPLIAACYLIVLRTLREQRRKERDEQQIAVSLLKAVRDGVVEFGVEHSSVSSSLWVEDEEDDAAPNSLILSPYRVLGYSGELRERATACEELPTRTIIRPDPCDSVTDRELLLGIPGIVLKPEWLPFPWSVADKSSPSKEDAPKYGFDFDANLIPNDSPAVSGGLELQ